MAKALPQPRQSQANGKVLEQLGRRMGWKFRSRASAVRQIEHENGEAQAPTPLYLPPDAPRGGPMARTSRHWNHPVLVERVSGSLDFGVPPWHCSMA